MLNHTMRGRSIGTQISVPVIIQASFKRLKKQERDIKGAATASGTIQYIDSTECHLEDSISGNGTEYALPSPVYVMDVPLHPGP